MRREADVEPAERGCRGAVGDCRAWQPRAYRGARGTTVGVLEGRPWRFVGAGGHPTSLRVQERLRVDSGTLALAAARCGVGFAIVVEAACRDLIARGELVRVALDRPAAPLKRYAAYPQRRHLPATARAFIDYLVEAAGACEAS